MPKKVFSDIVPRDKKSIRHIPIPDSWRSSKGETDVNEEDSSIFKKRANKTKLEEGRPIRTNKQNSFLGSRMFWFTAFTLLIVLVIGVFSVFSGATVLIVPKTENINVSFDLTALEKGLPGDLTFKVFSASKKSEKLSSADAESTEERKAFGTIIVYNNFSNTSQRFIKNTRFETPEGLIFRIQNSIVVPGRTEKGGVSTPGSLEVLVYADNPGPKYNIGKTDFTLPAFRSDGVRFKGFFARSKTPMTGGFSGVVKTLSKDRRAMVQKEIQLELLSTLIAELRSQIPKESVFFDGAYKVSFESLPSVEVDRGSVSVTEQASLTGFIFPRAMVAEKIARAYVAGYDGAPVEIQNLESLRFNFKDASSRLLKSAPVTFSLKGPASVVWLFDSNKLIGELAGVPVKNVPNIFKEYGGIFKAEASVRPFWKSRFPDNVNDIKVVSQVEGS